jgi:hypothetical protein
MNSRLSRFAALLLCCLAFVACRRDVKPSDVQPAAGAQPAAPAQDPREVVARVDGEALTWEEMDKRARAAFAEEGRSMAVPAGREGEALEFFRRRAVNIFVFKCIMLTEARKRRVVVSAEDRLEGSNRLVRTLQKHAGMTPEQFFKQSSLGEAMVRQDFEDSFVIERLLKNEVQSKVRVEDGDLDALTGKLVTERTRKRKLIDGLRDQLLAGSNFMQIAQAHSDCSSSRNGGDLGQIARGRMPQAFDEAAFTQKIGVIGPVIETVQGLHVIQVTARQAAVAAGKETPALPETVQVRHLLIKTPPVATRRQLFDEVMRVKYKAELERFYNALKPQYKIESLRYKELVF